MARTKKNENEVVEETTKKDEILVKDSEMEAIESLLRKIVKEELQNLEKDFKTASEVKATNKTSKKKKKSKKNNISISDDIRNKVYQANKAEEKINYIENLLDDIGCDEAEGIDEIESQKAFDNIKKWFRNHFLFDSYICAMKPWDSLERIYGKKEFRNSVSKLSKNIKKLNEVDYASFKEYLCDRIA